eukprot:COSAG01_NODE_5173_length_4436_cov_3.823611_1_plen_138_part_00
MSHGWLGSRAQTMLASDISAYTTCIAVTAASCTTTAGCKVQNTSQGTFQACIPTVLSSVSCYTFAGQPPVCSPYWCIEMSGASGSTTWKTTPLAAGTHGCPASTPYAAYANPRQSAAVSTTLPSLMAAVAGVGFASL